jgi:hypothetical protein
MLRQRRVEYGQNGMRRFSNTESHARSKGKNRSVAGRMHEGGMHKGKPENIPETGERNSFRRAVRSAQSAVQKVCERKENRDLIAPIDADLNNS